MADVTIRPLRPGDVDACAALMLAIPLWGTQYRVTPEAAHAAFAVAVDGRCEVRVAEQGGLIVGFVEYTLRGTFVHSGYVRALGVAEDARGRGVGTRLLRTAEDEILRYGPNVFLLVAVTNPGARRFYERHGYHQVGELPGYVSTGVTEILYRKTHGPIQADV